MVAAAECYHHVMSCAGYLLVGGMSTRMGVDKALLKAGDHSLAELLAHRLSEATETVTLVGDPTRYGNFGWPVIPDGRPGQGPLAGIEAALQHVRGDWALVLGCDMPRTPLSFLQTIAERTSESKALAIVPEPVPGGLEPLCAAYHRDALPHVSKALNEGRRKVKALLESLPIERLTDADRAWFQNLNTPEDWQHYCATLATV